jgi:hypothetical protein
MQAVTRSVLEMLVRVITWLTAHPDDEPGMVVLTANLRTVMGRMTEVVDDQRKGRIDSHAATIRKQELRSAMLNGPIAHLSRIGKLAGREVHELRSLFTFKPTADTQLAFHAAARGMYAAAQSNKEVLVKYGLSESVLGQFGKSLDELDAAAQLGSQGRTVHTAASRELLALTKEARGIVRAMDARNRLRFQDDRQSLEQWVSARTVLGRPSAERAGGTPVTAPAPAEGGTQGGTPGAGGDVRPAA